MISKGLLLGLGHFGLFLIFYVFRLLPTNWNTLQAVKFGWFLVFVVFVCRTYFEVPKLAHKITLLTLIGIITLSSIVFNLSQYAFNTWYDDQFRYARGKAQIEQINERRDRRNLPREVFDQAKVDAQHDPEQYFYNVVNSSIANVLMILLLYPLGILYWKVRQE
jgi:hypothetical protein